MSKWMLMAVAVSSVGMSACGGGARGERLEKMVQWRVDDALDELDATAAQRERVQALTRDTLAAARPLGEQAQAARTTLIAEWKSSKPDSTRVHQLVDAQLESVRAFAHQLVDRAVEVHQLLTPAQRDQISGRLDRFEKRSRK